MGQRPVSHAGRGLVRALARVLGSGLCLVAAVLIARQLAEAWAYRALAADLTKAPPAEPEAVRGEAVSASPRIDWEALSHINGDIAAWVTVRNTDISLPVLRADEADADHYLSHDLWGRASVSGTPFLDHRCEADGAHRLVFGHHLPLGGQFSQLQTAFRQERFDRLDACIWQTPSSEATVLLPLCALTVDQWFADIQRFSFADGRDLRLWLAGICEMAPARAADADALAHGARSAVTLVTCSSDLANQPWRTLVVFVQVSEGAVAGRGRA